MGRRKPSDFLSVEEIGRRGGDASRPIPSLSRLAVFNAWSRAVGPMLRPFTSPSDFRPGRLVVDVSSPIWIAELQRLRVVLLESLDRLLPRGTVSSIAYRLRPGVAHSVRPGGPPVAPRIAGGRAAALQPPALATGVTPGAHALSPDEDLRRRFSEVARRYMNARSESA